MNKFENLGQIEAYNKAKKILTEMYDTDQGKKFIHHLIYAFNSGIVTHIAVSSKSVFDCISKSKLNTVYENFYSIKNKDLKSYLKIIASTKDENEKLESIKLMEAILKDELKENPKTRLALKSTLTNKVLGTDEYQALLDFSKDQINKGNATIKSMTRYMNFKKSDKPNKVKKSKISKTALGADDDLRAKLISALNK